MRRWMQRLIEQFEIDGEKPGQTHADGSPATSAPMSDDRATLLYMIDVYNKHLLDMEQHPVRKVRETLDAYSRELLTLADSDLTRTLFRFRQFFSSYRVEEYTYVQKTFNEFRSIIWEFVDQLSEDLCVEQHADRNVRENFELLKEAVESDSLDLLRTQSRAFIDSYVEHQSRREERRSEKMEHLRENLDLVSKKLIKANQNLRLDHLTSAYNRKSFDEQVDQYCKLHHVTKVPVTLLMLDIDHFKRINDTYGHAIGDFILKECVALLKKIFARENDIVARVGGEEFAVLLPEYPVEQAAQKAEKALSTVRGEIFVQEEMKIQFTISIGIAQLQEGETTDQWYKRADQALYTSKKTGRDRYTVAPHVVSPLTSVKKIA